MRPMQQTTAEVQAERAEFARRLASLELSRLVFVDESGVVQGLRARYGYAPLGEPCVEAAPYRKGRRTSLIGYVGMSSGAVTAMAGTVTRAEFERFVVDDLAPSLVPGAVVSAVDQRRRDNHTIHKSAAVREAIEACGAVLLAQPRYSPDLNAVEMLWSKIKHLVRRARADTAEALDEALRAACAAVSEADLRGWICHVHRVTTAA